MGGAMVEWMLGVFLNDVLHGWWGGGRSGDGWTWSLGGPGLVVVVVVMVLSLLDYPFLKWKKLSWLSVHLFGRLSIEDCHFKGPSKVSPPPLKTHTPQSVKCRHHVTVPAVLTQEEINNL